jgi:hypothetical protein
LSGLGDFEFRRVIVLRKIFIVTLLLGSGAAFAQVAPSVRGGNSTLWVGGEFSSFNSDYDARSRIIGPGVDVDYNITPKIGLVGEARWLHWNGTDSQTQSDYLAGAKYSFRFHRFTFGPKMVLGGVWIKYPVVATGGSTGSYFAYAPGGFVDYRVSRHFAVFGAYEYQFLPSAPGFFFLGPSNGLTPHGFSVGVKYRILGVR